MDMAAVGHFPFSLCAIQSLNTHWARELFGSHTNGCCSSTMYKHDVFARMAHIRHVVMDNVYLRRYRFFILKNFHIPKNDDILVTVVLTFCNRSTSTALMPVTSKLRFSNSAFKSLTRSSDIFLPVANSADILLVFNHRSLNNLSLAYSVT